MKTDRTHPSPRELAPLDAEVQGDMQRLQLDLQRLRCTVIDLERRTLRLEGALRLGMATGGSPARAGEAGSELRPRASDAGHLERQALPADRSPTPPLPEPALVPPRGHYHELGARALAQLALICFAYGAATALRTLTHHHVLPPRVGTGLGLVYCLGLVLVPLARGQSTSPRAWTQILAISGTLLAASIAIESVQRASGALDVPGASLAMLATGVAASSVASRRSLPLLAATALVGPLAALALLGLTAEGLAWRAAAGVALLAVAHGVAHARGWRFLRPLATTSILALLGVVAITTAHRESIPEATRQTLALIAGGAWLVLAADHGLRLRSLRRYDRFALPLTTLWAYGVTALFAANAAQLIAGTAAFVALLLAWRTRSRAELSLELALTTGLLAATSLPWIDRSGLALMVPAFGIQALGSASARARPQIDHPSDAASRTATIQLVLSHVLALVALGTAASDLLGTGAGSSAIAVGLGGALAATLCLHYELGLRALERSGVKPLRWIAALSLGASIAALYLVAWRALVAAGIAWETRQPALTLWLGALALGLLLAGRIRAQPTTTSVGLLSMLAVAAKVVLLDIPQLDGVALGISVVTLGLVAASGALLVRRPASHHPETSTEETTHEP